MNRRVRTFLALAASPWRPAPCAQATPFLLEDVYQDDKDGALRSRRGSPAATRETVVADTGNGRLLRFR